MQKIFEKIIFTQISSFVNKYNILCPNQSGFRSNHSATSALLNLTNDIFTSFENQEATGAIFLDLTKAFDTVDHYLLLDKLYSIGLSGDAVLWFNSYLHGRKQFVVVQGKSSDVTTINKGVPQGSSLGPLLFAIYINDLSKIITRSKFHLYADDTVIYSSHQNVSNIEEALQYDFNNIQTWLFQHNLILNNKKSYSMLFKNNMWTNLQNPETFYNDGSSLENTDTYKYLGLWIDQELTFKPHIDYITKKVYACLGQFNRSINCFNLDIRKRIAQQLVQPIIDYEDIIYQNTTDTILKPLTTLTNSLCRFVLRCNYFTHHCTMYNTLNWLQPKDRRSFMVYFYLQVCKV